MAKDWNRHWFEWTNESKDNNKKNQTILAAIFLWSEQNTKIEIRNAIKDKSFNFCFCFLHSARLGYWKKLLLVTICWMLSVSPKASIHFYFINSMHCLSVVSLCCPITFPLEAMADSSESIRWSFSNSILPSII